MIFLFLRDRTINFLDIQILEISMRGEDLSFKILTSNWMNVCSSLPSI